MEAHGSGAQIGHNVREQVPGYHRESPESAALLDTLAEAAAKAAAALDSVRTQADLNRATWGLDQWEQMLGLETVEGMDDESRRSRCKARLRGAGATTLEMVKNTAAAYSNGEVEITEYPKEYRVTIRFTGTLGLPPRLEDLSATLTEIMPAHILWEYSFIFNTWKTTKQHRWSECKKKTWKQVKEDAWA